MAASNSALAGVCIALLLGLVVLRREPLRQAFLRSEDRRAMAALRIALTASGIIGVLDAQWLFPYQSMLLSPQLRISPDQR